MVKLRKLCIPIAILVILLSCWVFRWENMETRTVSVATSKWTRDRWTDNIYFERFVTNSYTKKLVYQGPVSTNMGTLIWCVIFLANGVWMFKVYRHEE